MAKDRKDNIQTKRDRGGKVKGEEDERIRKWSRRQNKNAPFFIMKIHLIQRLADNFTAVNLRSVINKVL